MLGVLVRESLQLGSSRRDLARSVIAPLRYQPYRLAGGQPVRLVPPGEQLSLEVEDGNTWHFFCFTWLVVVLLLTIHLHIVF